MQQICFNAQLRNAQVAKRIAVCCVSADQIITSAVKMIYIAVSYLGDCCQRWGTCLFRFIDNTDFQSLR